MATKKLYYQDQYIRSFTASHVNSGKDEEGRFYLVLDQTAFYPTGGGQPYDIGTLSGMKVYDVAEVNGEIRHYIKEPAEVHHEYSGEIDWERRFDHMQQHAGQHILSAAFEETFTYKTVSFHLGKEICTIDLETANLTDEEAEQVECKVNEVILENRPIETKWVTREELSNYSLRKVLSVSENIRLVIIPDFDYNGCGGTHPESTGQVSSIKILHWEKQKKKIRVYFVCGGRVLMQLSNKHRVVQGLTDTLNAPQENLNQTAVKISRLNNELEKKVNELKMKLIEYEAYAFIGEAEVHHGLKIAKVIFQDRSMPELRQLAKSIAFKADGIVALAVNESDNKFQFVCARSEDVNVNMNDLVKQTLPVVNGKGGGNVTIAQGGGEKVIETEELMEYLINYIRAITR